MPAPARECECIFPVPRSRAASWPGAGRVVAVFPYELCYPDACNPHRHGRDMRSVPPIFGPDVLGQKSHRRGGEVFKPLGFGGKSPRRLARSLARRYVAGRVGCCFVRTRGGREGEAWDSRFVRQVRRRFTERVRESRAAVQLFERRRRRSRCSTREG